MPADGDRADRAAPPRRADFRHYCVVTTRWHDNDLYGHVNNVVYYAFFDTAVNGYLVGAGALDLAASEVVGLVVETGCRFVRPIAFPDPVEIGLRVGRLGRTSVRYELGVFSEAADQAAAFGHFVHVYVERATRRPVPLPARLRDALLPLVETGPALVSP